MDLGPLTALGTQGQEAHLTMIMNGICTNYKNTTNWGRNSKKLIGIMWEILQQEEAHEILKLIRFIQKNRN